MVLTLADMDGNETFDPAHLGSAEEVVEERVADDNMIMVKGCKWVQGQEGEGSGSGVGWMVD